MGKSFRSSNSLLKYSGWFCFFHMSNSWGCNQLCASWHHSCSWMLLICTPEQLGKAWRKISCVHVEQEYLVPGISTSLGGRQRNRTLLYPPDVATHGSCISTFCCNSFCCLLLDWLFLWEGQALQGAGVSLFNAPALCNQPFLSNFLLQGFIFWVLTVLTVT